MVLSDVAIKKAVKSGGIKILPKLDVKNIRPAGVRLHLGDELLIPAPNQTVDISGSAEIKYKKIKIKKDGYIIRPGEFVLGTTHENIQMSKDIVGKLDGRSTIARLGLLIHLSSDTVDGNHEQPRSTVLEMKNVGNFNLRIKPRDPVAMIVFHKLTEKIKQKNQEQYKNQTGVQPPNLKVQLK